MVNFLNSKVFNLKLQNLEVEIQNRLNLNFEIKSGIH